MKRIFQAIFLLTFTWVSYTAGAAESTFDTTTEGWSFYNDANFSWNAFGNPGGSIRNTDRRLGTYHGFRASSAFLGDKSAAFGGSLQWDIHISAQNNPAPTEPDVTLQSDVLTLVLDLPPPIPG